MTGGRPLPAGRNGLALVGAQLPAAVLLGAAGPVALRGHDGMLHCAALLAAWPVVLLIAELVRNRGRRTLADVLTVRTRRRPVRIAAGISSVAVSVLYLAAQLAAAGSLAALLPSGTGADGAVVRGCAVAAAGALAALCVLQGGMRAVTRLQLAAAVLLTAGALALVSPVLLGHGADPAALLAEAGPGGSGPAPGSPVPGAGQGWAARLDLAGLTLALVLGTAGLPHVLARLRTVPTARAARHSVVWAAGLTGLLVPAAVVLGPGAAAPEAVRAAAGAGGAAPGTGTLPSGPVVAAVAAAVLVTASAAAAGALLAAAVSAVHDLRGPAVRHRDRDRPPRSDAAAVRRAAVAVVAAAVALVLPAGAPDALLLAGTAFAVAASAHLPVLLYSLFWRRFTARGALWTLYGGLASVVLLTLLSPAVSGGPQALLPERDFALFPLSNPAPVSVPLGFLAGWLGSRLSPGQVDATGHARAEVLALTGAGAR
ncbi:cation acetate symporter [Streptomyces sp. TRM 70361]|uniref:sodium:solute symporter family transporter n=1 Tax=Streptomyces sp. TRM 70361 TaxID=3116553 RepID=UPI002E7AECCE|nr:cation acetate symporter [Streptomyces sp. TRM 70361]MEE1940915.1 cation acetate symporter [Streptomyces sp. TRM 70361]